MSYDNEEKIKASKYRENINEAVSYWNWAATKYDKEELKAIGFLGAYDPINEYQDYLQRRLIMPVVKSKRPSIVLDVGCGLGRWTKRVYRLGISVIGCDVSEGMLEIAKKRVKDAPLVIASLSNLCFRSQLFDLVLSITVLQHIIDSELFKGALKEIVRVTKRKGTIALLEEMDHHQGLVAESRPLGLYIRILEGFHCKFVLWRGVSITPYPLILKHAYERFAFIIKTISLLLSIIDRIFTSYHFFSRKAPHKFLLVNKH